MKIELAGYNIDSSLIPKEASPETITSAYARISRSWKPLKKLREESIKEINRSRQSNKKIIYEYGHSSIAEHAVFNFDLSGISRLAVEKIESHRLNSYTEQSQRYVNVGRDFIIPFEIKEMGLESEFKKAVKRQFEIYLELYKKLIPYFQVKCVKNNIDPKRAVYFAKEDARYVLPLSVTTQLGMTINARNLEYMIQNLKNDSIQEVKEIGSFLEKEAIKIAPSLFKYADKDSGIFYNRDNIFIPYDKDYIQYNCWKPEVGIFPFFSHNIVFAGIYAYFKNISLEDSVDKVNMMSDDSKLEFSKEFFKNLESFDKMPREFELCDFIFDLVMSSSCFSQFKRHRMATIIPSSYDLNLGVTIPESVGNIGGVDLFFQALGLSEKLYDEFEKQYSYAAPYVLTNAHRRRVIFKSNFRELYHFSRLREDKTSQWEIRCLAKDILDIMRARFYEIFFLSGGKDKFNEIKNKVYEEK